MHSFITLCLLSAASLLAAPQPGDSGTVYEQHKGRNKGPVLARWTAIIQPRQVKPGDTVTITIDGETFGDWHTYSPNQKHTADDEGPYITKIKFLEVGALKPDGPFRGTPPHAQDSKTKDWKGLTELHLSGKFRWSRKFVVSADAKPGEIPISGGVDYQICDPISCINHGVVLTGSVMVGTQTIDEPAALRARMAKPGELGEEADPVDDSPESAAGETRRVDASGAAPDLRANGFIPFMIASFVAGLLALMTPCVFPMVPITVSFFHKQAEQKHSSPLAMATVYSLAIIGTFTGLGMLASILFGASSLQQFSSGVWFNVGMSVLLLVFACNMLGMFEIVVPSWMLSFTSGQEARGGYIGIVFMALTFTLTSFTCTFAFLGGLLTMAANGDRLWPIFGLLGFSSAFALPFFFLALFPGLMQKLPQAGGWMNSVKVIMGLLEIGAAFKFLSNVDLVWNGQPWLFDFELVMSAWMVLCIVGGLYLLGLFQTPHDIPSEKVGVPRLILSMSSLGMAAYLAVGLFGVERTRGVLWDNIVAFAPPTIEQQFEDPDLGTAIEHAGVVYSHDPDKALALAIKKNLPLFIDFTGITCTNCRQMESTTLAKRSIVQRLQKCICVRVYTDRVPVPDQEIAKALKKRNLQLQNDWMKESTLPGYVMVIPTANAFETESSIVSRVLGTHGETAFSKFLDEGITRSNAVQSIAKSAPNSTPQVAATPEN